MKTEHAASRGLARVHRAVMPALFAICAVLAVAGPAGAAPDAASPATANPLPGDSIYQLPVPLTDQTGRSFMLADRRGTPLVISMFYTSCQFTCPMLLEAVRATEMQLSMAQRNHVNVLLVSFDPAHDTVAVLARTAGERKVDDTRWSLARTDPVSVRKLAAVLGIQYRALGNGDFNHTTTLVLVDAQGRIVGRTNEMGGADPKFVKLLRGMTAAL